MRLPHKTAEIAFAATGLALVAAALAARQSWLDRHFLPSFLLPRLWYVRIETAVRASLAAFGLAMVLGAPAAGSRLKLAAVGRAVQVFLAVAAALVAGELLLRLVQPRAGEWRTADEEPRRQPDATMGWTFVPARAASVRSGGRTIEYALDDSGYRVRSAGQRVDPAGPAVLFAGESVMFGDGLAYHETIPAQVESMIGVPGANLAVYGFSTAQMLLRLQAELPRFQRPVAVVALFMTALFGRNLETDRPYFGRGLVSHAARPQAKIVSLAALLVPYRRSSTVENGIVVTSETLSAIVTLAASRGAAPLIVVPQIGPEALPEQLLRRRILDDAHVPYVFVDVDPSWHVPWDRHPDARAAHTIAAAIASRLRQEASIDIGSDIARMRQR